MPDNTRNILHGELKRRVEELTQKRTERKRLDRLDRLDKNRYYSELKRKVELLGKKSGMNDSLLTRTFIFKITEDGVLKFNRTPEQKKKKREITSLNKIKMIVKIYYDITKDTPTNKQYYESIKEKGINGLYDELLNI